MIKYGTYTIYEKFVDENNGSKIPFDNDKLLIVASADSIDLLTFIVYVFFVKKSSAVTIIFIIFSPDNKLISSLVTPFDNGILLNTMFVYSVLLIDNIVKLELFGIAVTCKDDTELITDTL